MGEGLIHATKVIKYILWAVQMFILSATAAWITAATVNTHLILFFLFDYQYVSTSSQNTEVWSC